MNQKGNVASALGSILLGILLIVMKGKIITAAITLLAVFVIVGAIMDFVAGLVNYGIVKSVAGICILVFGWVFASLAFYILAAGIRKRFQNVDLEVCVKEIVNYIKSVQ